MGSFTSCVHDRKCPRKFVGISGSHRLPSDPEAYFHQALAWAREENYVETLLPVQYAYGRYLCAVGQHEEGLRYLAEAKAKPQHHGMMGEIQQVRQICQMMSVEFERLDGL